MLNKIVRKKNLILIIYAVVLLVFWTIALIFGNGEDKVMVLILSLVIPFVVYGFVRLMYKVISINAFFKAMRFFYCFYLVGGLLGTVMMLAEFIGEFPNGLSPTLGSCGSLIVATLDSAKKNIEIEGEKHGLTKDSVILAEQIRTIDKRRLKEKIGRLDDHHTELVDYALKVSFGLS